MLAGRDLRQRPVDPVRVLLGRRAWLAPAVVRLVPDIAAGRLGLALESRHGPVELSAAGAAVAIDRSGGPAVLALRQPIDLRFQFVDLFADRGELGVGIARRVGAVAWLDRP